MLEGKLAVCQMSFTSCVSQGICKARKCVKQMRGRPNAAHIQCYVRGSLASWPMFRPKKIIVWLSSITFFGVGVGGRFFFSFLNFFLFSNQSQIYPGLKPLYPNKGANKSLLSLIQVLNQY